MGPSLAIFDLDGTLVDSREDLAEAGNAARLAVGLPALAVAEVAACVGDGLDRLIERLVPDGARDAAKAAFLAAYAGGCTRRTRAYDGVAGALAALRTAGWRTAVATNKPEAFSRRILVHLGLMSLLDGLRGGDGAKKPDPGQLLSLMGELGSSPEATWMVGDHRTDLLAARAAGCRSCFCGWGIGSRDGLEPDRIAASPCELPQLLLAAGRRP